MGGNSSSLRKIVSSKRKRSIKPTRTIIPTPKECIPSSSVNNSPPPSRINKQKIETLFDNYADGESDEMGPNGVLRFCDDIEVDPEDVS